MSLLPLLLFACEPPPPDEAPGLTPTCGPINVAISGFDATEPVPAESDHPSFGHVAPDPAHVHLSWSDDPATTMAFIWQTDDETTATRVEYGPTDSYGSVAHGASFFIGADGSNGRVHEAHLCNLQPGTTYHYRVGGFNHWSEDRTFTTAPPPGEASPFRFAVLGDSRDNPATFGLLLDALEPLAPDFYLFTGDAVRLGSDMAAWDAWFDAGEGHLDSRPMIFAQGNHELQTQNWYALFAQPGNEQWFGLDYADAHFSVLTDTEARPGDREVQAGWLAEDLAGTRARWRFAAHHMPAYTSCTGHDSDAELQALWSPVEEAGGVAVDFTGHNHNYERSYPLVGGVQTTAELGTTYLVSGGAGASLYDNALENDFTEVAYVTENYVLADVRDGTLTITAYDLANNVLDTFTTTR